MTRVLVIILPLVVFSIAAADEAADKERERFVGVWQGFVVEGQGENPNRGSVKLTLKITKDSIIATQDKEGDLGEGSFSFDLSATPHTIDC